MNLTLHASATRLFLLLTLGVGTSSAQVTNLFSGLNRAIPDGQVTGMVDTHTLAFTNHAFWQITNVQLTIKIEGGYNGDLYGYLVHGDGFAVLFNREGRTSGNRQGYNHGGFDIMLADGGEDLHFYQAFGFDLNNQGQVTGTWGPDGRRVDPGGVNEHAERSALFGSFNGLNPNGTWTLFLADVDFGEQATLVEWGLVITAVPEPAPFVLLGLAALLVWRRANARRMRNSGENVSTD
jgi:subtilisin-like proprotein convertase family protein